MTERYAFGIDPGISGALALVEWRDEETARVLYADDLPTVTSHGHTELLLPTILATLDELSSQLKAWPHVFIEKVHAAPRSGVSSMFRFGYAAGALAGLATGLSFPVTFISPQQWQHLAGCAKDPDAGRYRASFLFPDAAHRFAMKKDHNRADAALIAYAGLKERNAIRAISKSHRRS